MVIQSVKNSTRTHRKFLILKRLLTPAGGGQV